jgi:ubiquinone/menaquinone biosynthesis C-methylase UbiE
MSEKVLEKHWLRGHAEGFLRRAGVSPGQSVLDFGCGEGKYAIPAAKIVGKPGRVYVADKDKKKLSQLMRTASKEGLDNVVPIHAPDGRGTPVSPRSIDLVLLYDVLHCGYLPEESQRGTALRNIYRALKPGGVLSCYPTHLKKYGMTFERLLKEIRRAGFRLEDEHRRTLLHDGKTVRGRVFRFTKPKGKRK